MNHRQSLLAIALLSVAHAGLAQDEGYRGVVLSSVDGSPLRGTQVWLLGTPHGALTDSLGRFTIGAPRGSYPLVARVCGRADASTQSLRTGTDSAINIRIMISVPSACPPVARPPWEVGSQDSTVIEGEYLFSWEGNSMLICRQNEPVQLYRPALPLPQETMLRRLVPPGAVMEGARVFVRLRGRPDDDPSTRNFSSKTFFVAEILEARELPQLSFKEWLDKRNKECGIQ